MHEKSLNTHRNTGSDIPAVFYRLQFTDWALIAAISVLAYALRWWLYPRTIGATSSICVEEMLRLQMAVGTYDLSTSFPILRTMGPFQMFAGRLGITLFPHAVYITRWISLICGIASPGIVYLALNNFARPVRLGAALALCVSPAHIWISTLGVAESLTFFLVFASCLCYTQAISSRRMRFVWGFFAIAFLWAAFLTRFETWIIAPFFFIDALIRFGQKRIPFWLLIFAVPAIWLIYCKVFWDGFLSSTDLQAGTITFAEALEDVRLTLRFMYEAGGWAGIVLGCAGFVVFARRKESRYFALIGISIIAFEFAMMLNMELMADLKYSRAMIVWMNISGGAFIGAAVVYFWEKLGAYPKFRMKAAMRSRFHQYTIVTVLTATSIFSLNPLLGYDFDTLLTEQGTDFDNDRRLLEYIETQLMKFPDSGFVLLTTEVNRNFIYLYLSPQFYKRVVLPQTEETRATEILRGMLEFHKELQKFSSFRVVTQSSADPAPADDLPKNGKVLGHSVLSVEKKGVFTVYDII